MAVEVTLFDDSSLDADTRAFLQEKEQSIRTHLKKTVEDILAIGADLIDVKKRLERGEFVPWIQSKFEMSLRSAEYFMQYAERFGGTKIAKIAPTSMVLKELLNSEETIIEMIESGEIEPTIPAIREANKGLQQSTKTYTPIPFIQLSPEQIQNFNEKHTGASSEENEEIEEGRVSPWISRWRADNESLGLDKWANPLPSQEEPKRGVPTALLTSESNEWFTPSQYVEKARELMGGIDLDPASNAYANEKVVQATTYYDIQTNGLDKPWNGRVWLNPPYGRDEGGSNQEAWSRRLIEQYEAGITKEAVLLVNANTEAKWFQPLYNYLICFTNHRIRFYNTEGTPSQPTQGNAFIYFGHQQGRFTELFSTFGVIIRRIDNGR